MNRLILLVLLINLHFVSGCGSPKTSIYYKTDCPQLTQDLVDSTDHMAEEYFGDREFKTDIYVSDAATVADYCEGASCATLRGIVIPCGSADSMGWSIAHEYGHMESFNRFNDWDRNHERFLPYWNQWVSVISYSMVKK